MIVRRLLEPQPGHKGAEFADIVHAAIHSILDSVRQLAGGIDVDMQ
jgi:hypothetical protein